MLAGRCPHPCNECIKKQIRKVMAELSQRYPREFQEMMGQLRRLKGWADYVIENVNNSIRNKGFDYGKYKFSLLLSRLFWDVNKSERMSQAISNIPHNKLGLRRILRGLTTFSVKAMVRPVKGLVVKIKLCHKLKWCGVWSTKYKANYKNKKRK